MGTARFTPTKPPGDGWTPPGSRIEARRRNSDSPASPSEGRRSSLDFKPSQVPGQRIAARDRVSKSPLAKDQGYESNYLTPHQQGGGDQFGAKLLPGHRMRRRSSVLALGENFEGTVTTEELATAIKVPNPTPQLHI